MRELETATASQHRSIHHADDARRRHPERAERISLDGESTEHDEGHVPPKDLTPEHDADPERRGPPQEPPHRDTSGEGCGSGLPGEDAPPGDDVLADLWSRLSDALGRRVGPEQFETWFRRACLVHLDDQEVRIAVQNAFARDWLVKYYVPTLEQSVHAVLGVRRRVHLTIDPELAVPRRPEARPEAAADPSEVIEAPNAPTAPSAEPPASDRNPSPAAAGSPDGGAGPGATVLAGPGGRLLWNSDVVLHPKYTFENFVVGPCNRFGHAAAMGAGEQPGKHYNPFFLHGRVGVGKTHLLQAVCHSILSRWGNARILYLSCETFVNHFIAALENGDLEEFRNKYRRVDVLVVDDIHLLANKERTQEEFFHTFNTLYNANKQIVLSSDSPPKDIPTLQDRLVSRFKWGMVTEIEPPCYETRMAIVKRKSRDRGCEVPDVVAQLIAEHIHENVRELEGAVTRLIGYASLTGKEIGLELAREALADLLQVRRGAPSMDDIIQEVTQHFGVKLPELQSKRRTKSIAYPRQVAMYLARKITRHSLEEIGGWFGGRDHSTVLYAVDRITDRMQSEDACRQSVEELLGRLQGGGA